MNACLWYVFSQGSEVTPRVTLPLGVLRVWLGYAEMKGFSLYQPSFGILSRNGKLTDSNVLLPKAKCSLHPGHQACALQQS